MYLTHGRLTGWRGTDRLKAVSAGVRDGCGATKDRHANVLSASSPRPAATVLALQGRDGGSIAGAHPDAGCPVVRGGIEKVAE